MSDLVIGICIGVAGTYLGSVVAFLAFWRWMLISAPVEPDPVEHFAERFPL